MLNLFITLSASEYRALIQKIHSRKNCNFVPFPFSFLSHSKFSVLLSSWGEERVWEWAGKIANAWRTTGDIFDRFGGFSVTCPFTTLPCPLEAVGKSCTVMNIAYKQKSVAQFAGPGGFNDLDMVR